MNTTSYWSDSTSIPRFASLKEDCRVDVAVVGAGITGVTAAYLFKKAGHTVALIERGRCGGFDTANTTAHLTCVTDKRLHALVDVFGKTGATAVWEAGQAAIDEIVRIIRAENISCEFDRVPGYLHAPIQGDVQKEERETLTRDADLATELGFPAEYIEAGPFNVPAVKFHQQAKFHPCKYLAALLRVIPGDGSHVFENTEAGEVHAEPLTVAAGEHKIRCRYIVLATHTPLMGKANVLSAALLQSKLFLYTTYAVGAQIPAKLVSEALFWDTSDPYHYLRTDRHRGYDYAILGGEDHKTGQKTDSKTRYAQLEKTLTKLIPDARVDHRWSGQVIETADGLPYIGESASRQFIATGFGGNGMTFGTLGAMIAVDAFLGRKNPWAELFNVHRKKLQGTWNYLKENKDYPYFMVRDWLGNTDGKSLGTVKREEGSILHFQGKKVAAYRDAAGEVTLLSPVCTHLKCIVSWNKAEKTWDCPCHGSRFAATGEVLAGPAEQPLERIPLEKISDVETKAVV